MKISSRMLNQEFDICLLISQRRFAQKVLESYAPKSNLSVGEKQSIQDLNSDSDILADKGNRSVILNSMD